MNIDGSLIARIIFYSLCGIVVIAGIITAWVLIYKRFYYPKKFKNVHYKIVKRIVHEYDYRLINNFVFPVEESKNALIDHIIFGDKYFYVILSHYYNGDISGNINDKSLIFTNKKGKKYYTDNPYKYLNYILTRFSTSCGIDKRVLIGVVLTDDACNINVESEYESYFVCKKKNLSKLIKKIESRRIGKINDDQLQKAVLTLSKMNRRKNG